MGSNPPIQGYESGGNYTPEFDAQVARLAQSYNAASNRGNFITRHPILSSVIGGVLMGPAGAIAAPLAGRKLQRRQQEALARQYAAATQAMTQQARTQNELEEGRVTANTTKQILNQYNPQAAQVIDPRANLNATFANNLLTGASNAAMINPIAEGVNAQQQRSYGVPMGQVSPGQPATSPGLETDPSVDQPVLTGGVSQLDVPNIPAFVSPQALNAYASSITSAANTGLTQGQGNYEFQREFPSQERLREQRAYRAQQAGDLSRATIPLRGAQTRAQNALVPLRAQQGQAAAALASLRNRTDPNIRAQGNPYGPLNSQAQLAARQQKQIADELKLRGFVGENGAIVRPEGDPLKQYQFDQLMSQYNQLGQQIQGIGGATPTQGAPATQGTKGTGFAAWKQSKGH